MAQSHLFCIDKYFIMVSGFKFTSSCLCRVAIMSTMNGEIYAALIEAGLCEEKARAAAVSVTCFERNINEIKT